MSSNKYICKYYTLKGTPPPEATGGRNDNTDLPVEVQTAKSNQNKARPQTNYPLSRHKIT